MKDQIVNISVPALYCSFSTVPLYLEAAINNTAHELGYVGIKLFMDTEI